MSVILSGVQRRRRTSPNTERARFTTLTCQQNAPWNQEKKYESSLIDARGSPGSGDSGKQPRVPARGGCGSDRQNPGRGGQKRRRPLPSGPGVLSTPAGVPDLGSLFSPGCTRGYFPVSPLPGLQNGDQRLTNYARVARGPAVYRSNPRCASFLFSGLTWIADHPPVTKDRTHTQSRSSRVCSARRGPSTSLHSAQDDRRFLEGAVSPITRHGRTGSFVR